LRTFSTSLHERRVTFGIQIDIRCAYLPLRRVSGSITGSASGGWAGFGGSRRGSGAGSRVKSRLPKSSRHNSSSSTQKLAETSTIAPHQPPKMATTSTTSKMIDLTSDSSSEASQPGSPNSQSATRVDLLSQLKRKIEHAGEV